MYKSNIQTEYRQELRKKILETASKEFKTKGIKSVKMDDIANLLSVSKRTVYEIYENKEQLLMECVKEQQDLQDQHMQKYAEDTSLHVIDLILEFYRLQMRELTETSAIYFIELQRYPEIIAWLNHKHQETEKTSLLFFQRGVKEGYFRQDVNYELFLKIANGTLDCVMKDQLYKQYEIKEIFCNVIMFYVRGLCTMKGIEELEKQIRNIRY